MVVVYCETAHLSFEDAGWIPTPPVQPHSFGWRLAMWGGIIGLIIQVIAGAVGGNVTGTALKQYDLGVIGAAVWHRIREQPQSALSRSSSWTFAASGFAPFATFAPMASDGSVGWWIPDLRAPPGRMIGRTTA